ncbi:MAG: hypothetical protein ACJA0H_000424 [Francisellaceae bacterium]|jgi:hypothetical protein
MFKNVIKNNFIRNSVLAAICASSSIANAGEIRVVFSDAEGAGFNSQEPYVPEGGNNATTLG